VATRTLDSSPSILPLYARAAAPMVPGASLLPFLPGGGGEIPELDLSLEGVVADPADVAAYAKVCGFALRDSLPVTYPPPQAGFMGLVEAWAPELATRNATINADPPGFIYPPLPAALPLGPRDAGPRLSSLSQGGLPVDVAEAIAWFASPASTGVNGNVVRVCGQNLLGA
jgi:3-oxoacyl-[acyl-carrier protein] reductase